MRRADKKENITTDFEDVQSYVVIYFCICFSSFEKLYYRKNLNKQFKKLHDR